MKIIIGLIVSILLAGGAYLYNKQEPVEYIAPIQKVATSTPVVELDNISEAQKQLNEAKKLLDDEDAEIVKEVAKLEARREEIRKVRLSFSQAPGQAR